MADQAESPIPTLSPAPASGKNTKTGKAKNSPKVEYGALRFRLPKALERAIRYASFELEENPKAVHKTPQALLEEAVRRHLDLLSKHIHFPVGMLPHKSTPE